MAQSDSLDPFESHFTAHEIERLPLYRRLGLGKAAVLEGIRRCGALGATEAFVGNDLPIYRSVGFEKIYVTECWLRYFE